MKKQEKSPPIDELFARKLGNASLSPGPNGFERLQARMNKAQPEARVIIWQNPVWQRYMAIAACLVLVCLFGWLYLGADSESVERGDQVANSIPKPKKLAGTSGGDNVNETTVGKKIDEQPVQSMVRNQLGTVNEPVKLKQTNSPSREGLSQPGEIENRAMSASEYEQPVINQLAQNENKAGLIDAKRPDVKTIDSADANTERMAGNTINTTAPVERVLTVTIEEPTSLIAARQLVKKELGARAAIAEKPDNETKGSLWQQVKRIKQGEVFARHDNPVNEDQSLLGRAYSGLKQSFEKDKSER